MDEKDYELLLELYETKNITKTAQKLFITQPALSKRIQRMEEELQCQLFLRSKKGVVFTPAGESVLPYARTILANSRLLKDSAAAARGEICGTISLGASLNFAQYRLPAILKDYTSRYPKVDVQITTGQSRNLFQLLKEDRISIAVMRGQYAWEETSLLISSEPMCLICSRENMGRPLTDYPYIGRHTDAELTGRIERWLSSHGLSGLRSNIWIDDINACKAMARHGLGWCILPHICLEDFDGYIEEMVMEDGSPFLRNTYVLCRQTYASLPQVRLFLDALTKNTHEKALDLECTPDDMLFLD